MCARALIIAEIGENHMGDWDLAHRMVVAAAQAGADIVKFQSYLGSEVSPDDPEREWFLKVHLPDEQHFMMKAIAEQHGARFLTAPFSLERARFAVEDLELREVKVASSEMLNAPLLEYLNGKVDTVFLSTGMATLAEVKEAVDHLQAVPRLYVLHCTSEYPCPDEHANLRAIATLKAAFPHHRVGFSDHTIGLLAPVVAVALGAEVIEKHFTLDKTLPGTDHVLSVTAPELEEMISQVRTVEQMLNDGVKRPSAREEQVRTFVRSRFPKSVA